MADGNFIPDTKPPRSKVDSPVRLRLLLCVLFTILIFISISIIRSPYLNIDDEHRRRYGTIAEIANLKSALDLFKIDVGHYPTTAESFDALLTSTLNDPNWKGPYIMHLPLDRWGHPYIYRFPSPKDPSTFDLLSPGPDGIPDTKDDITKDTVD